MYSQGYCKLDLAEFNNLNHMSAHVDARSCTHTMLSPVVVTEYVMLKHNAAREVAMCCVLCHTVRLLIPQVLKAVVAQFNASQLITQRAKVGYYRVIAGDMHKLV